ncbi:MAG: hypothetical protein U9Q82_14640, partial [Chloroflexota bacterium]|nr:hypothetical protein [Chloroflexota bacterium]
AEIIAGDYKKATQRLEYMATNLLSRGEHKLAKTVLAEVNHVQTSHKLSKSGRKQIKFGTRSLLLSMGNNKDTSL